MRMSSQDSFPELPPEMLLAVFQLLPVRDLLLAVRGVCRWWRELAADPSVWQRKTLRVEGEGSHGEVIATLAFAPCVRSLTVGWPSSWHGDFWNAACTTDCAVTKLHLSGISPAIAPMALRALGCQVRLQKLRVLGFSSIPRHLAQAFITVALTADLTDLYVDLAWKNAMDPPIAAPFYRNLRCPSLKDLSYESHSEDGLLEYLLFAHRGTLESVDVWESRSMSRGATRALCECQQLRKVFLPADHPDELSGLCSLPLLIDLSLAVRESGPSLATLTTAFRNATKLKRLEFSHGDHGVSPGVVGLLRALSSTGKSALRELRVSLIYDSIDSVRQLPGALPGLRQLQTLYLDQVVPLDALVDAITPGGLPCLRLLCFLYFEELSQMCPFDVCSYPALFEIVRRNRRLHIGGLAADHDCKQTPCKCCVGGLHPIAPAEPDIMRHCCLFGHGEAEECEAKEAHTDSSPCLSDLGRCCDQEWFFVS